MELRDFHPAWTSLTSAIPVYATWDDHDYFDNDRAGVPRGYTQADKEGVCDVFRQAWNNLSYGFGDERRGVFFRARIGPCDVIMLDHRYYRSGQKGSSAMPHKKNPILCERIAGLSRILRSNSLAAMENVSLWHERDITHSSVERIILPDSTILLHYMLTKFYQVIDGLRIYRDHMERNLMLSGGTIFSQGLLLTLVDKGLTRPHEVCQPREHGIKPNLEPCEEPGIGLQVFKPFQHQSPMFF